MKLTDKLNRLKDPTDKQLLKYYHNPVEIIATQWGCDYIMNNLSECKKFLDDASKLIKRFYEINNIEN